MSTRSAVILIPAAPINNIDFPIIPRNYNQSDKSFPGKDKIWRLHVILKLSTAQRHYELFLSVIIVRE